MIKKVLVIFTLILLFQTSVFAKNGYLGNGEKLRIYFEKDCKICANMDDDQKAKLVFKALKDVQLELGLSDISLGENAKVNPGDVDVTDALIRKLKKINTYF